MTAAMVDDFLQRKHASSSELATLSGNLSWASQVITGGSTFQTRTFALQTAAERYRRDGRSGRIPLSEGVRADLRVWRWLLANANQAMPMRHPPIDHESWSDASGRRCGGCWCGSVWQISRTDPRCSFLGSDIAEAEIYAVAMQCALYGPGWRDFHLVFRIDNKSDWVASADNPVADAVTRQDMASVLRDHPGYHAVPDGELPILPSPSAGIGWEIEMIETLNAYRR